jgi:hypothetical protein
MSPLGGGTTGREGSERGREGSEKRKERERESDEDDTRREKRLFLCD